jgi:hypothetical protein
MKIVKTTLNILTYVVILAYLSRPAEAGIFDFLSNLGQQQSTPPTQAAAVASSNTNLA